jgi:hypothetical protein
MAATAVGFVALAAAVWLAGAGLGWLWAALLAFMVLRAVSVWWRWRSDRWIVLGETVA